MSEYGATLKNENDSKYEWGNIKFKNAKMQKCKMKKIYEFLKMQKQ